MILQRSASTRIKTGLDRCLVSLRSYSTINPCFFQAGAARSFIVPKSIDCTGSFHCVSLSDLYGSFTHMAQWCSISTSPQPVARTKTMFSTRGPANMFRWQTVLLFQLMLTLEKNKKIFVSRTNGLCSALLDRSIRAGIFYGTERMVTPPSTSAEPTQRPDVLHRGTTYGRRITTIYIGQKWVVLVKLRRLTNSHIMQFGARHILYVRRLCAAWKTLLLVAQFACSDRMSRCLPSSAAMFLYLTRFYQQMEQIWTVVVLPCLSYARFWELNRLSVALTSHREIFKTREEYDTF